MTFPLTLKMTTTRVVETSVTNNSLCIKDYPHPDDHSKQINSSMILTVILLTKGSSSYFRVRLKQNQEKKPTYLCTPCEFLKQTCQPCQIIIQSCYFDYRINKPYACSRCMICILCSVLMIFLHYVCKGSWAFLSLFLATNQ